ncbi:hypothetical protein [Brevibacterium sp. CS2]|uniref:hypothetical protein n=1 Tax=Brevibacterium sp. CS2 TaxID=2575923 RepID=UPI0010C789B1|nr:hypothetical protein [Brevibacterium sp. CS2]QCP06223.1 hypothetical protein FDF13_13805 [Brevibacterium sp. CS2]
MIEKHLTQSDLLVACQRLRGGSDPSNMLLPSRVTEYLVELRDPDPSPNRVPAIASRRPFYARRQNPSLDPPANGLRAARLALCRRGDVDPLVF